MITFPLRIPIRRHSSQLLLTRAGLSAIFVLAVLLIAGVFIGYLPNNIMARGVWVQNTDLSGLSQEAAASRLQMSLGKPPNREITISTDEKTWATGSATLNERYDQDKILTDAYAQGRTGSLFTKVIDRFRLFQKPVHLSAPTKFDPTALRTWVSSIAAQVDIAGRPPSAKLTAKSYIIDAGQQGQELDQMTLLMQMMLNPQQSTFSASISPTNIPLSPDGQILTRTRLDALRGKSLTLTADATDVTTKLTAANFFPWLTLPEGYQTEKMQADLTKLLTKYDREPRDARWEVDPSNAHKLKVFEPEQTGRTVDEPQITTQIQIILNGFEAAPSTRSAATLPLPFSTVMPKATLGSLNPLGVKERIGYGISLYAHSIPNRVFNVSLTSEHIDNTLVLPGEEFSFADTLGEVDQAHGFKQAYIIKDGSTQLGDGGGVCQVSTTVFRALLNAGLPITARKAHSYRVGYYEQNAPAGYDATVFAPNADLKFINDTGHAIVISSKADAKTLRIVVELWGSSDGRTATLTDYAITNQSPAPPTVYQDDPTLPRGTQKQVDFAAPGATVKFTYTVKNADGTPHLKRIFTSVFQPWHAVYLVGTR